MAILGVEAQAQRDSGRRILAKAKIRADMGILSVSCLRQQVYLCTRKQASGYSWGVTRAKAVPPRIARQNKVITAP
jgi:hypothetical protein